MGSIHMQKALFYIVAGENEKDRAIMGLQVARRSFEFKRFGDVKVIIQGPSEKLLIDEDREVKKVVDYLMSNRLLDSACSMFAEKLGISESIANRGVELKPSGEQMAIYVNDGYIPLIF